VDADPIVVWYYTLCVSSQSKMAMVHENKDQKPMVLIYLSTKISYIKYKVQ
jgi:hypothetical protein